VFELEAAAPVKTVPPSMSQSYLDMRMEGRSMRYAIQSHTISETCVSDISQIARMFAFGARRVGVLVVTLARDEHWMRGGRSEAFVRWRVSLRVGAAKQVITAVLLGLEKVQHLSRKFLVCEPYFGSLF